jgi:hypothetical protein
MLVITSNTSPYLKNSPKRAKAIFSLLIIARAAANWLTTIPATTIKTRTTNNLVLIIPLS